MVERAIEYLEKVHEDHLARALRKLQNEFLLLKKSVITLFLICTVGCTFGIAAVHDLGSRQNDQSVVYTRNLCLNAASNREVLRRVIDTSVRPSKLRSSNPELQRIINQSNAQAKALRIQLLSQLGKPTDCSKIH